MGLHKAGHGSHWSGSWGVPLAILLVAIGLELGGDGSRQLFRYDSEGIAGGELFRLVSGHLVHLGWPHLVLNLAGLVLVWLLVGSRFSSWQWLAIIAASMLTIDAGFLVLMPDLAWYVGLSGVLHGMLAAGALALFPDRRTEATVLLGVLVAKLGYEMLIGPMPGSAESVGGSVIVEAHLFGAIGGALAAIGNLWRQKRRPHSA
ncbi:MAG: rhombosortase [Gammaproteobacteria bacterium]|nr:rhombosortase [Gammaproteobacteria bacterium]